MSTATTNDVREAYCDAAKVTDKIIRRVASEVQIELAKHQQQACHRLEHPDTQLRFAWA